MSVCYCIVEALGFWISLKNLRLALSKVIQVQTQIPNALSTNAKSPQREQVNRALIV